jgi:hypothetical protein
MGHGVECAVVAMGLFARREERRRTRRGLQARVGRIEEETEVEDKKRDFQVGPSET